RSEGRLRGAAERRVHRGRLRDRPQGDTLLAAPDPRSLRLRIAADRGMEPALGGDHAPALVPPEVVLPAEEGREHRRGPGAGPESPAGADPTAPLTEPDRPWFRQGGALAVARGGDALLRFALFLATARVLDPHSYALYALLTAVLATAQWAAALGAPRASLYLSAKGVRGPLFGWLYGLALGASLAVFLLAGALPPLRRALFPAVPTGLLFLALAPLPFSLLSDA